jgi:ATP-dependent Clp protease ATP-binding subunit ClpA
MTSNAGAADMSKPVMGFGRTERTGEDTEAVNRMFAPEFRNRLDATISFDHLSSEVVGDVVEKFVTRLEAQLADRGVVIELDPSAKAWLVNRGYDKQNGARPLARLIAEKIKKPLADEVLFGKLVKGGTVRVKVASGELTFDIRKGNGKAIRQHDDEADDELV